MAAGKSLSHLLLELRRLAPARHRRPPRAGDATALIARLIDVSRTVSIEERSGGVAFRLQAEDGIEPAFALTCVLHHAKPAHTLTTAEHAVAGHLCEGRTLAQVAHLRGVSTNTVKSQVRQLFRKLDVESRVALVRKLCP